MINQMLIDYITKRMAELKEEGTRAAKFAADAAADPYNQRIDELARTLSQIEERMEVKQHPQYGGDVPLNATAPGDESGAE